MVNMNYLTLADWRRRVAAVYEQIRKTEDPQAAWVNYKSSRDQLFAAHDQSPLDSEQLLSFNGLHYYPYNARLNVRGRIEREAEQESFAMELPVEGAFRFRRIARVRFEINEQKLSLALYWVEGYGGGLFLPFRDRSNGRGTYGGGRYLYDGIKGADLGTRDETILLDFNFAYNPSCAYNDRWVCPLAPPENWLDVAVIVGERVFQ